MKSLKSITALLLVLAVILSLGMTAYAEEAKTETKTFRDEKGNTVTEVYDEDGYLIHKEEPYYKNGKLSGTLCYDAIIWCSWDKDMYAAPSGFSLPVMKPDTELDRCLSYTLNMAYFKVADKTQLGLQTLFCRENDVFHKTGYIQIDELETFYDTDVEYETPTKIDGFAIQPYKFISTGQFSLLCALTDVYYLK